MLYQETKIVSLQQKILKINWSKQTIEERQNGFQDNMLFLSSLAQGLTLGLFFLFPSAPYD